jgi:hypothetical protein
MSTRDGDARDDCWLVPNSFAGQRCKSCERTFEHGDGVVFRHSDKLAICTDCATAQGLEWGISRRYREGQRDRERLGVEAAFLRGVEAGRQQAVAPATPSGKPPRLRLTVAEIWRIAAWADRQQYEEDQAVSIGRMRGGQLHFCPCRELTPPAEKR